MLSDKRGTAVKTVPFILDKEFDYGTVITGRCDFIYTWSKR